MGRVKEIVYINKIRKIKVRVAYIWWLIKHNKQRKNFYRRMEEGKWEEKREREEGRRERQREIMGAGLINCQSKLKDLRTRNQCPRLGLDRCLRSRGDSEHTLPLPF